MYIHQTHTVYTTEINSNVNSGHWITMMYQCAISCNKCSILMGMLQIGKLQCVGVGGMWELFVLSSQCCCDPKPALKIRSGFPGGPVAKISRLSNARGVGSSLTAELGSRISHKRKTF